MEYLKSDHNRVIKSDPRFTDIGNLPSEFIPYSQKQIFIRPFTISELKLLSKSIVLKDIKHLIKAVDNVIDIDVNDLTVGDFYYILMWLRLHSFPKSPIMVQWRCDESIYRSLAFEPNSTQKTYLPAGVAPDEEQMSEFEIVSCNTGNNEAIHMTDITVQSLDEDFVMPEGYDFPRVKYLDDVQKEMINPEMELIAPAAQWISGTWIEKMAKLENDPGLSLFDMATALQETVIHGVSENAILTCRGCKKKSLYLLQINATTFFRQTRKKI